MTSSLKIGLLTERRYMEQLQPAGLIAALKAKGHRVDLIDPEARAYALTDDSWSAGFDIVVCRGRSVALQSLLRWAEAKGIRTLNRLSSIASVFNKAEMAVVLASSGVPTPDTYLGPVDELSRIIPEASYPVVIKPVFGDNCRDLRLINSSPELMRLKWSEPFAMAQQFLANDGYDLKLYGIGRDVWAVRKPSCLANSGRRHFTVHSGGAAHPVSLSEDAEALALRCAELFGLELFGVDCIDTPDGPSVIEVNDFPNYSCIAGVDEKLADFVLRAFDEKGTGASRRH